MQAAILKPPADEFAISIRPQSLRLNHASPGAGTPFQLSGKVVEAAFAGETWDYVIATEAGLQLRGPTPATQVLDIGAPAWVMASADQIVVVP